jgi:hypothetical protein
LGWVGLGWVGFYCFPSSHYTITRAFFGFGARVVALGRRIVRYINVSRAVMEGMVGWWDGVERVGMEGWDGGIERVGMDGIGKCGDI